MGWFDNIWNRNDPLKDIDPTLREFLEKEAPTNYKTEADKSTAANETATEESQSYREQVGLGRHNDPVEQQKRKDEAQQQQSTAILAQREQERVLPTESLFQDGRYKHLWKNYRPQDEIDEAGKSDQEKLTDIVSGYKQRQAEVGRAALENCSNEQWAVHECFRSGSWSALTTMCKAENRELSRCVMMQSRFLRALEYVSIYERPVGESERIQMHADQLYHRMLKQEKVMNEARERGEKAEVPALMREFREGELVGWEKGPTWETLPEAFKEKVSRERFKGLEGLELEVAKKELESDVKVNQDFLKRLDERYREERMERLKRQAEGKERIGDKVKRWFDFRDYKDEEGEPGK